MIKSADANVSFRNTSRKKKIVFMLRKDCRAEQNIYKLLLCVPLEQL